MKRISLADTAFPVFLRSPLVVSFAPRRNPECHHTAPAISEILPAEPRISRSQFCLPRASLHFARAPSRTSRSFQECSGGKSAHLAPDAFPPSQASPEILPCITSARRAAAFGEIGRASCRERV